MFYIVYKTTNIINGKFYIGKHKTKNLNDNYMGSGKLLKQAIEKYGKQNFVKEILFIFDNQEDMNDKEKELVVLTEDSYNLCEGGNGGFDYINSSGIMKFKGKKHSDETKKILSERQKGKTNYIPTPEYKARMSEIMKEKHAKNPGFNNKVTKKNAGKVFTDTCLPSKQK